MKKIIAKARQYESKSSLDGKMRILKGNVGATPQMLKQEKKIVQKNKKK